MGTAKDKMMENEDAKERAAKARGRICWRCQQTVPFDDPFEGKMCSYCASQMAKD